MKKPQPADFDLTNEEICSVERADDRLCGIIDMVRFVVVASIVAACLVTVNWSWDPVGALFAIPTALFIAVMG